MALDYPYLNLSDMAGMNPAIDTTSISSSNIVSSSIFMAEGLDVCCSVPPPHISCWSGPDFSGAPPNVTYSSPPHLQLSTPDSSPRTYPYPPPLPCNPVPPVSTQLHVTPPLPPVRDLFFCGSSLEESPISSPGDLERDNLQPTATIAGSDLQKMGFGNRSSSPLSQLGISLPTFESGSSAEDDAPFCRTDHPTKPVPDGIKMPQRKGGMQLWQFLYSMLNDKDRKYRNLIEWTHTAKERQFRLLEPDAIAVWWGHHKNKPNMSYDKLSRSLRYYYDKGIIRKISGERFVYRFCIDPEVMYKHMGTSNARPQLKPMPQDAKIALSKDRNVSGASPCVALEPEALPLGVGNTVEQIPASYPMLFPPTTSYNHSLPIPATSSYTTPSSASTMRRCHSYDSACRSTAISPVQTPSPCSSGAGGFPSLYDNTPATFNGIHSPNNSPPQSATLQYKPFTTQPSELPQQTLPYDYFSSFSVMDAIVPVPPFTSSY